MISDTYFLLMTDCVVTDRAKFTRVSIKIMQEFSKKSQLRFQVPKTTFQTCRMKHKKKSISRKYYYIVPRFVRTKIMILKLVRIWTEFYCPIDTLVIIILGFSFELEPD